jgi:hypothetical protein
MVAGASFPGILAYGDRESAFSSSGAATAESMPGHVTTRPTDTA